MPLSTSCSGPAERGIATTPPPLWERLPSHELKDPDGKLKLDTIMLHFLRQGRLSVGDALDIVQQAALLLRTEENVLTLNAPLTVVGDIHGQFYDLAKIVHMNGSFAQHPILFLGNYIGGGGFSCECILYLLAVKLTHPNSVFLLRGSHESTFMTDILGFEEECKRKYSKSLYATFQSTFNCLPLAAVVSNRYFCVHGGLSPNVTRVDDVRLLFRFRDIPAKGAMCDLLWADPHWDTENPSSCTVEQHPQSEYYTPVAGSFEMQPTFFDNEQRRCSYLFNFACVKYFTSVNKLLCIVRSHEVQEDGFKLYRANPNNNFPSMISVFSAPNYCDTFDNKGAIIQLREDSLGVKQFFCSPHPCVLHGLNGITWSLPFVADSLQTVLTSLVESEEEDEAVSRKMSSVTVKS